MPVVNHKNFDKSDNHIANLEWVTYSENSKHSFTGKHREKTLIEWVNKVQHIGAEASKTKVAQYDLVKENDYNLSVSTYVEKEDTREKIDIVKLNKEIDEIVAREEVLRAEIKKIIEDIEGK